MSDFKIAGSQGKTIRWRVTVTKTLDDGTVSPVDLTLAGTKLIATAKLNPADLAPLLVKDYYASGGAPNGGVTVPAPGLTDTDTAEIKIDPTDPAIVALTRTSYIMVDVELHEPDGTETSVAKGVIKLRVGVGA